MRERGRELPHSLWERIECRCDRLVREALAYHETSARAQSGVLAAVRWESVLQFLSDRSVLTINNQAEQDVRMTKLRMQMTRIEALLGGPAALLAGVHSQMKPSLC